MLKARASLTLAQLVAQMEGAPVSIRGSSLASVSGLSEDSRRVSPGDLFVARAGLQFGADRFVADAVARGASAVLGDTGLPIAHLPQLVTSDVAGAFGWAAQALAGHPSRRLPVVGITGTNGKTTTLTLVAEALRSLRRRVATLGTLGFSVEGEKLMDTLTTPQPDVLASALATAEDRGAEVCVMEVSSHALSQKRVEGVQFEVAAFSNLSQDHLDYHCTMAEYGAAKARLFELSPRSSVINVGDPFGAQLAARYPESLRVDSSGERGADLSFRGLMVGTDGVRGMLEYRGERLAFSSALVGHHNAENLLLALGILLRLGVALPPAAEALAGVPGASGRLERCDGPLDDVICLVDYAHTPDALKNVLLAARRLGPRPLVCVFGCGGDRDRKKRPLMGESASGLADTVWVTTDNPRSEDPEAIIEDIRPGLARGTARVFEELDRREAIRLAVAQAEPGSVIAICGKGHETYQIIGATVHPFDDRDEARGALALRREGGR